MKIRYVKILAAWGLSYMVEQKDRTGISLDLFQVRITKFPYSYHIRLKVLLFFYINISFATKPQIKAYERDFNLIIND